MTEDVESALLGHVVNLAGAVEHVRGIAEQTLEQAKRTNGRVNLLEEQVADHTAWRSRHDHEIDVTEAHTAGQREAHAEHAARHRKRRAMFTGTLSWVFDNWQALAWVLGGIGVMALARWMP